MQVRLSPIALWTRSAATAESTPPLMPHTTLSVPTFSLMPAVAVSMKALIVQSGLQPQTRKTKFFNIRPPIGVWTTSGWNCTPYIRLFPSIMAHISEFMLRAMVLNPEGRASTLSPWLIQTLILSPFMP